MPGTDVRTSYACIFRLALKELSMHRPDEHVVCMSETPLRDDESGREGRGRAGRPRVYDGSTVKPEKRKG